MTWKQEQSDRLNHKHMCVASTPMVAQHHHHHHHQSQSSWPSCLQVTTSKTYTTIVIVLPFSSSFSLTNNYTATFSLSVSVWKWLTPRSFQHWDNNTSQRFLSKQHGTHDGDQIAGETFLGHTTYLYNYSHSDLNWSNFLIHLPFTCFILSVLSFSRHLISIWIFFLLLHVNNMRGWFKRNK